MTSHSRLQTALMAALFALTIVPTHAQTPPAHQDILRRESEPQRTRDRLWIWGHPASVYNDSYLAPLGKKSTMEPVAAAQWMGIANMIFVRYEGQPQPPFETYFEPFKQLDRGQQLPITAVVYARQISPSLKPYLDEVNQVSLWTWRPADLDHLPDNLAAVEKLIPGKPVLLGCYMYDFDRREPLSVERMKMQVETGYRWLREGRVAGMIFLATPNVDVGLEAVEWTRKWIAQHGDEPLE